MNGVLSASTSESSVHRSLHLSVVALCIALDFSSAPGKNSAQSSTFRLTIRENNAGTDGTGPYFPSVL
jgi:hypothetical protein